MTSAISTTPSDPSLNRRKSRLPPRSCTSTNLNQHGHSKGATGSGCCCNRARSPISQEFGPVQRGPLNHEPQRSRWQAACQQSGRVDSDRSLVVAVADMEVRRRMVVEEEQSDDDAEKPRDLGHWQTRKHPRRGSVERRESECGANRGSARASLRRRGLLRLAKLPKAELAPQRRAEGAGVHRLRVRRHLDRLAPVAASARSMAPCMPASPARPRSAPRWTRRRPPATAAPGAGRWTRERRAESPRWPRRATPC